MTDLRLVPDEDGWIVTPYGLMTEDEILEMLSCTCDGAGVCLVCSVRAKDEAA